jgi:hypothetical protein
MSEVRAVGILELDALRLIERVNFRERELKQKDEWHKEKCGVIHLFIILG